ncbi:MAG: hypothetical protein AB1644_01330 [Candidatus Zixiibacteriota bacterium]
MTRSKYRNPFLALLAAAMLIAGLACSKNSLAPFQPEIANIADNFQFQATGVKYVSTTLTYSWSNSGDSAKVNHASVITGGSATVTLLDANGVEKYTSPLKASGDEFSQLGVSGNWTIRVVLSRVSGTLNFRVQKQ